MKTPNKETIKNAILVIFGIIASFIMVRSLADFQRARKVLINDSEKVIMEFYNNKIEITAVLLSQWILDYNSSLFYLYMRYDLEDKVTMHGKAIDIKYKEKSMRNCAAYNHSYQISGEGLRSFCFSISEDIEVKKGDKIKITAPDFITYNGGTVSLEEMTIEIGKFYR